MARRVLSQCSVGPQAHTYTMRGRDKLLDEIERGALDERKSLSSLLRRCIMVGSRTGSTELRDWASRELSGYVGEDDVPSYRTVPAIIAVDGISVNYKVTDLQISVLDLPDFVRESGYGDEHTLRTGIATIEELAHRDDTIRISLPESTMLARFLNSQHNDRFREVHRVYLIVNRIAIREVLDQIRNALVELVAEMLATLPKGEKVPTKAAADMAVNYVITGRRNTINIVNAQASDGGTNTITSPTPPAKETFWQRWRKRGVFVGIATVVAAVAGVATWLDWLPW